MIAIIDYGVGNLQNLKNALDFQEIPSEIVTDPARLKAATHVLLPGVGAFRPAMEHLTNSGMIPAIETHVAAGRPFFGICVGMQLLFDVSEEDGHTQGLGLIKGRVVRFNHTRKIPQIGWNQVRFQHPDPMLEGIEDGEYFYFVHSYHAELGDQSDGLGITDYGVSFPAIVRRGNIWGAQFHPEKSQNAGLRLLANFAALSAAQPAA